MDRVAQMVVGEVTLGRIDDAIAAIFLGPLQPDATVGGEQADDVLVRELRAIKADFEAAPPPMGRPCPSCLSALELRDG